MPKNKQKTKTAIYHPPKKGMPYLVVTVSPEGVVAIAVECSRQRSIEGSSRVEQHILTASAGALSRAILWLSQP